MCGGGGTAPTGCVSPAHKSAVCQEQVRLAVRDLKQSDLEKIMEAAVSPQSAPSAAAHRSRVGGGFISCI